MSTIALAAITGDRKATSMSEKAKTSTNPTTSGSFEVMSSELSFHWAVRPVTPASTSGTPPTVFGTISSRSSASEALETESVPLPSIGMVMFATVPASLTTTVIGSCMRPLASARSRSRSMAACIVGSFTSGALTTTLAGRAVPGNASCMWS